MIPRLETMLIYAKSGMTKTTQLYHIVKYLHGLDPTKQFRLVTAELGNNIAPFEDSGMIENGIVDVFDISGRERAFADVHRIAKGYWPRKTKTGEMYFESDEACMTKPDKWAKIGGYLVEGLTSLGKLWLNHCSDQVKILPDGKGGSKYNSVGYAPASVYEEDDVMVVSVQTAHYGIVQKEIHKFHQHMSSLPIQGGILIYTALVGRGDEDLVAKRGDGFSAQFPIYGPKLVGNAMTSEVPSWFRHTIHLDTEKMLNKEEKTVEKVVGWFVNHTNFETGINYLAKPRILPEMFPKLMEKFPGGYCQIGFKRGLDRYLEVLGELREEFREQLKSEKGYVSDAEMQKGI